MIVETGVLITIGVQIGVSLFNLISNNRNTEKIRKLKQEAKRDSQKRTIRRDYERFVRSCQCQLEMERISRQEQIENRAFHTSFKKLAHKETLLSSNYPLRISPYIVDKSVLPYLGIVKGEVRQPSIDTTQAPVECLEEEARQHVFCILTNSNNKTFNSIILPDLDEAICLAIAQFWNKGSLHNICYYQGIWNNSMEFSNEDIKNVEAVVSSPTLTITPYIEKKKLSLKAHFWGMGQQRDMTVDTGFLCGDIDSSCSEEEKQTLLSTICPMLLCLIGQMVDVYYWGFYYQAPLLPHLLSKGSIPLSDDMRDEIIVAYDALYTSLALGKITDGSGEITTGDRQILEQVTTMNMFNFPERNIGFLKSCTTLMGASETSNKLIERTMLELYEANTERRCTAIEKIDVSLLNYDVMRAVSELVDIANNSGNYDIAKRLTDLIVKKIRS